MASRMSTATICLAMGLANGSVCEGSTLWCRWLGLLACGTLPTVPLHISHHVHPVCFPAKSLQSAIWPLVSSTWGIMILKECLLRCIKACPTVVLTSCTKTCPLFTLWADYVNATSVTSCSTHYTNSASNRN